MYLCLHIFWECVSIHAPWEGCDPSLETLTAKLLCFNSRTLGRVRPQGHPRLHAVHRFNSRTLGRVRLLGSTQYDLLQEFQFTHPGKGATTRSDLLSLQR